MKPSGLYQRVSPILLRDPLQKVKLVFERRNDAVAYPPYPCAAFQVSALSATLAAVISLKLETKLLAFRHDIAFHIVLMQNADAANLWRPLRA
jgi:hypothetical protein